MKSTKNISMLRCGFVYLLNGRLLFSVQVKNIKKDERYFYAKNCMTGVISFFAGTLLRLNTLIG
jgi:hypothetical protein